MGDHVKACLTMQQIDHLWLTGHCHNTTSTLPFVRKQGLLFCSSLGDYYCWEGGCQQFVEVPPLGDYNYCWDICWVPNEDICWHPCGGSQARFEPPLSVCIPASTAFALLLLLTGDGHMWEGAVPVDQ